MPSTAEFPAAPVSLPPRATPVVVAPVNWAWIAKCIGLLAITCACYWPALNGSFLWDDGLLIYDNPLVKDLAGLRDIWCSTKPYDFFPLTSTTFWIEWQFWGKDPVGYHLTNLALHLASAFLLWRLLLELRLPGAWFGALLFAIHPLNVASVAWIAERKNALSMAFYLACLLGYVRFDDSSVGQRSRWHWYALSVGCFVLAALSKSSVVMLPCVLLLQAWWRRGTITWRDALQSIPFFAVSLGCGLATMWFQYHRAMSPEFHEAAQTPLLLRLLMAGRCCWFYLGKTLAPVHLSMLYPRWDLRALSIFAFLPLLGWLALGAALWTGRTRWGRGPFAVFAYFTITLLPVSGIFHMSFFTYSYVSDHLAHLSLVGIVAGISFVLGRWHEMRGSNASAASLVMAAVAGLLAMLCSERAEDFSSQERLWGKTRLVVPENFAVYNNLGIAALEHGHLSQAEDDFRTAARLEPHSFSALNSLANVLRIERKWQESAAVYRGILEIEPNEECYNNLGVVFLELGNTVLARASFHRAIAMMPTMNTAYFNLYKTELADQRFPAAADALRGLLRGSPNDSEAMTALALLSLRGTEGLPHSDPSAYEASLALAERACQLTGYRNATSLAALSQALAATGRSVEAKVVEAKIATLSPGTEQAAQLARPTTTTGAASQSGD